jgi:hypothetical protein
MICLPLAAVVPHAVSASRQFVAANIHGAYVAEIIFANARAELFQRLEWDGCDGGAPHESRFLSSLIGTHLNVNSSLHPKSGHGAILL